MVVNVNLTNYLFSKILLKVNVYSVSCCDNE